MTSTQITAIIAAAWPVVGALGTALEAIGTAQNIKWMIEVGQRLEAAFVDFPKVLRGSRFTHATVEDLAKKVEENQ